MPQRNDDAGELNEGEEVVSVVLVADDGAPGSVAPAKEALDLPATFVTPEFSAVLGFGLFAVLSVWGDQFNTLSGQLSIRGVAVIRLVADQAFG